MAENASAAAGSEDVEGQEGAAHVGAQGQEDGAGDDEPTVEGLKAELDQVRKALAKANKDAERNRRKAQEAKPADEVASAAETAAAARWKPVVVRSAAAASFAAAGLQAPGDALPKVLRMLDLDALEIADDGTVDGLDDQVEEIKATLPALFAAPGPPKARPGRVDAGRQAPPAKEEPKSTGARVWAALQATRG